MVPRRWIIPVMLLAFIAGVCFTGGGYLVQDLAQGTKIAENGAVLAKAEVPGKPDTIAAIVRQAGPAVVKIETLVPVQNPHLNPFFNDPFFREFFGRMAPPQQEYRTGLGSGFIIRSDGYILTNEHVIGEASEVRVTVSGFSEPFKARVVGADYDLDLAVLKIEAPRSLPYLKLGDAEGMAVGDWVIAIGNPYGLDHTVTVGVLSAKGRPVDIEDRHYKNLLQTDASINPGNSGGPLLNLAGEVIGINTAVNAQAQGIGFAIPSNTVKAVLDDLIKKGKVVRPWLGVQVQAVDEKWASYLGLPKAEGALVMGVVSGSPAERAGIRRGDVILELAGRKVTNPDDLIAIIKEQRIGSRVKLVIWREGKLVGAEVTVNEKPAKL
uniref:PDZ domain-containing protein n=1 Tax=Ammonifex degensii TaxID=42838 RepID=A0A7C2E9N2_9THEO